MLKKSILFFAVVLTACVFGQRTKLINSGELISEGVKLHDEKKYQEALDKYNLIDRNDTNYTWALLEKALSYNGLENYTEAIKTCKEAINCEIEDIANMYNSMGSAYDDNKEPEKAIESFHKAIQFAPYDHLAYYNLALTYSRMENWDSTIHYAKLAVDRNLFHASSHFLIGLGYYRGEQYGQALLALGMFMLIEPSSPRSGNVLQLMLEVANVNQVENPVKLNLVSDDKMFETVNSIIKGKVALNSKYKTPVKKISDPLISQLYVLLEKLQANKDITNFWHRNYTGFFKEIYKQNYFEPYIYSMLSGVNNKKIQGEIKKQKSKINAFANWAAASIVDVRNKRYLPFEGKIQPVTAWYGRRNNLLSFGEMLDPKAKDPLYVGDWTFFSSVGTIETKAHFDQKGKPQGEWISYHTSGEVSKIQNYKDGELYSLKSYWESGAPKADIVRTGEEGDLKKSFFNTYGILITEEIYEDNKLNGKATYYYETGEKNYDVVYKDGVAQEYTEYNHKGDVISKKVKKSDELFDVTKYHENGKISDQGQVNNEERIGLWKSYHDNGKLAGIFKYDNSGEVIDTMTLYHSNGKIEEVALFAKGERNGPTKEYDDDGVLFYEAEYKNGSIIKYRYIDKKGAVLNEGEEKKGVLDFKGYYASGQKHSEGKIKDGKFEGLWKYYDRGGYVFKEVNFEKDEKNGMLKYFYDHGIVREQYNMKNGLADGYYTEYFTNEKISTEGWLVKDEKEGYWYEYNKLGELSEVTYYINDKIHGYFQDYSIDGKLRSEIFYKDELINRWYFFDTTGAIYDTIILNEGTGKAKIYSPEGTLIEEFEYLNGLLTGDRILYHYNGQIYQKNSFLRGRFDGPSKGWDFEGKPEFEGQNKDGQKIGEWKYYIDGKLSSQGSYKNGEYTGKWTYYYPSGKILEEAEYNEDGEIVSKARYEESGELIIVRKYKYDEIASYTYYDKSGNFVPDIPIVNGTGKVVAYYKNGNKSVEIEYLNGHLTGKILYYYLDGKLAEESLLDRFGDLQGIGKRYWPNGKLKSQRNYYMDDFHGESKFFRQDGTLEKIETYYLDNLHGKTTFYDQKGNVTKTIIFKDDVYYK